MKAAMSQVATTRTAGVQDRDASLRTRFLFWLVKRKMGRVTIGARIRAFDSKLLELASRMDQHVARPRLVPMKLTELTQVKVAMMVGCPF